jgi:hypothetical protein
MLDPVRNQEPFPPSFTARTYGQKDFLRACASFLLPLTRGAYLVFFSSFLYVAQAFMPARSVCYPDRSKGPQP